MVSMNFLIYSNWTYTLISALRFIFGTCINKPYSFSKSFISGSHLENRNDFGAPSHKTRVNISVFCVSIHIKYILSEKFSIIPEWRILPRKVKLLQPLSQYCTKETNIFVKLLAYQLVIIQYPWFYFKHCDKKSDDVNGRCHHYYLRFKDGS